MHWKKRKSRAEPAAKYDRLVESYGDEQVPKGYVPVLVGHDAEHAERFLVHLRLLNDPRMGSLLEMVAREFGYGQQGMLKIPCNPEFFRGLMSDLSR